MKVEVERFPKKEVKLKIQIDREKVAETRDRVVEEMVKNAEIKGFRKGEAPRNIVEPNLDTSKIRGEVINHLVPESYDQAVKESHIKPILLPKIELGSFEVGSELQFTATTCEAPTVTLGDYKSQISTLSTVEGSNLKSQITPSKTILGADGQPISGPKEDQDGEEQKIDGVLKSLLETATIEICDLIIDEEVNHMLSRLVDQTGRLGLTVDQYLVSIGKDVEALKKEYRQTAEKTLRLEFALMAAAKAENVTVADKEIEATINAAPDEESRKNLAKPENLAYIRSVILKNKTIQKLLEYTK